MKKSLLTLLITLILLPNFSNILVYFSYKLNQAEISRTLCIQKDFVENTCNGRCVLENRLKQLEQNQKKTETNIKEKAEIVFAFFSSSCCNEVSTFIEFIDNPQTVLKPTVYFFSFITSIFHPPSI